MLRYSDKTFSTYYNTDNTNDDSVDIVFQEVKDQDTSPSSSPTKSPSTDPPAQPPVKSPTFPPARLGDLAFLPGFDEEDLLGKKMRKHRVLFRTEQPIRAPVIYKIDAGGLVQPTAFRNDQNKLTNEVMNRGKESIDFRMHKIIRLRRFDDDPELQLIRHIQQNQFDEPIIKQYPPQTDSTRWNWLDRYFQVGPDETSNQSPPRLYVTPSLSSVPISTGNTFDEVGPTGVSDQSPPRHFVKFNTPVPNQISYHQPVAFFPPVFNTPEGYNTYKDGPIKPTGPITGYFPFVLNGENLASAQSINEALEYQDVHSENKHTTGHKHKHTRSARRAREINPPGENLSLEEETVTTSIPEETTVLPESRKVGTLSGPIVQTITQTDDDDKVQTTIVLHGGTETEDDDEDDDDDDEDDLPQSPTALDDSEEIEEEPGPPSTNKGEFQKKLKDKLDKIEQKIRKRIKTNQQHLNGLKRQVNRHVTEVVMHSEGGMEEAGPFVSKLVVRKGGVAIAGPGGIATAGFGGTAIVGPGGTAYTSPDSLAVAGPGARVISVPSSKLQEMFDSFRKGSGRNIEAFKPSWLGTIPPDGKLVATGPVVFFNPPEQIVPGFTIALDLQEKADIHPDPVFAEAPADLSRTSSEGFPPYIEPGAGGIIHQVMPEPLGGRPPFIPAIDSGRIEMVAEASPVTSSPVSSPVSPPSTVTPPSVKVREEMIAEVKEQIKAEISGAVQNQPLKFIDIVAPVEEVKIGASDQEKAVEEALKPYQDLLKRVQESSAVDLVVGDVRGNGEASTRLLLRPMAKAVAGRGGIAVAAPLSRAIVRGEQPVQVRYQPNIVAVAGPSGMAHALGELLLQYADRP